MNQALNTETRWSVPVGRSVEDAFGLTCFPSACATKPIGECVVVGELLLDLAFYWHNFLPQELSKHNTTSAGLHHLSTTETDRSSAPVSTISTKKPLIFLQMHGTTGHAIRDGTWTHYNRSECRLRKTSAEVMDQNYKDLKPRKNLDKKDRSNPITCIIPEAFLCFFFELKFPKFDHPSWNCILSIFAGGPYGSSSGRMNQFCQPQWPGQGNRGVHLWLILQKICQFYAASGTFTEGLWMVSWLAQFT